MANSIIEARNISKVYKLGEIGASSLRDEMNTFLNRLRGTQTKKEKGDFWALNDVSFDVNEGEVVGIIGKNGAGKSTLLKVISRITEPSYGEISLRGRVAALLEVGTGFHPELTGRENIYLNGTILGMRKKEIDRKLDEIVDFSGISQHIDTPIKRYSSGMNVRLGFAVAAHLEPEILIVDEVLAVGDLEFQRRCLSKMDEVSKNGRTVLFVSHNMSAVSNLCPRSILIDKGSIVMDSDSASVITHYRKNEREGGIQNADGIFENLYCVDKSLSKVDSYIAGDEIFIRFDIPEEARKAIVKGITLGLINEKGERILTVGTDINENSMFPLEDGKSVICSIPNNPLTPGNYSLKFNLKTELDGFRIIDNIPIFSIRPSNYYNNGHHTSSTLGCIVCKATWNQR